MLSEKKIPLARIVPVHSEPSMSFDQITMRFLVLCRPCIRMKSSFRLCIRASAIYRQPANRVVFKKTEPRDGTNCSDLHEIVVGNKSLEIWFFVGKSMYLTSNGYIDCEHRLMFGTIFTVRSVKAPNIEWVQFGYKNKITLHVSRDVVSQFCQNQTIEKHA